MSDWFTKSFGNDYLIVYKHRDYEGAYREVKRMIDWLQLPQGAKVLDLCCGMGRHSLALDECGYNVTGVDLSDVLLHEARRKDETSRVRWVKGDMRNVPIEESFDAVVNLFTSFGYFNEDEENAKVFREMDRLLKPGGKFIIDFLNPDVVAAALVPESQRNEGRLTIRESRRIEEDYVRKRITISEPGQTERYYEEQVKLYRPEQFRHFMAETNLTIGQLYGGYDASAYHPASSPRSIYVGYKKG
ncbi:class I SAM-dependent methyltransferase [Paenibacillus thalictri]|uniref:class I SAM-dependent methyltransferase n=1 Tax=Paenibacillus thalictri TaxID=2527873 RepID=UPI0014785EDB|nr:class I SAM-dependent methyltransferase [Paenibacillus thalictri]